MMRSLAQRALVWRLLAALLAVALVVSAPVMHAAPQTCLERRPVFLSPIGGA